MYVLISLPHMVLTKIITTNLFVSAPGQILNPITSNVTVKIQVYW